MQIRTAEDAITCIDKALSKLPDASLVCFTKEEAEKIRKLLEGRKPVDTFVSVLNGRRYNFCLNCKTHIRFSDKFCPECGRPVNKKKLRDFLDP